jgi:hypothetical protein
MCFFFSLIPATVWLVIGFFVLFASTRAEGRLRKFGQVLAIWAFIIAAFIPLGGAYLTLVELCPMEGMIEQMHTPSGP